MKRTISMVAVGLWIFLAAGIGIASETAAPKAPRPLTVDDYFRIKGVDGPQISPEGRWVAYTVTTSDLEEDEVSSRIWMVPSGGGEAVPMTSWEWSASHPRWSPDGRYLSFLSAPEDGEDQV